MKFTIVAVLSAAGLAMAVPRAGPPPCAVSLHLLVGGTPYTRQYTDPSHQNACVMNAFKETGCNANGNPVKCLCQKTDYHPKMRECAQKNCQGGDFNSEFLVRWVHKKMRPFSEPAESMLTQGVRTPCQQKLCRAPATAVRRKASTSASEGPVLA